MQPIDCTVFTFRDWIPIVGAMVTSVFVIIGWIVVHFLTQMRDDKKRLREEVDSASEFLAQQELLAIEYHCSAARDLDNEEKILRNLNRLARRIKRLQILDNEEIEVLRRFRASVTLDNFQSAGFKKQNIGSPIVKGIGACSDHIEEVLEEAYKRKARRNF